MTSRAEDEGTTVVGIHLGLPGSFEVRVFDDAYSPFVAVTLGPRTTLYSSDPASLASLARVIRKAQRRMRALQRSRESDEVVLDLTDVPTGDSAFGDSSPAE